MSDTSWDWREEMIFELQPERMFLKGFTVSLNWAILQRKAIGRNPSNLYPTPWRMQSNF